MPATIHCDHLIVASKEGAEADVKQAIQDNQQVYDFLQSAAQVYICMDM